jgi:hypothetical protein
MTTDNTGQGERLKADNRPNFMKIDSKLNPTGVDSLPTAGRSTPPAKSATDDTSFTSSSALEAALKITPDVRPSAVDRAKELISNPNFPSADTIKKLAGFFADKLTSNPE